MKVEDAIKFEGNLLAIMPDRIGEILEQREGIVVEDGFDLKDAINRKATRFKEVSGKVVRVPVDGYISHKATIWAAMGLETSSDMLAGWISDLVNNDKVGAIVLDVDSPGGTAQGLQGVSDKIYSLRGTKPIIAVVNDLMASAAYFIGSAADEIVSDPDGLVGSIGTIAIHQDLSEYFEKAGVKTTIFSSSKFKGEGNMFEPLTEAAKENIQEMVDAFGKTFVGAVARNRGTTVGDVNKNFGKGRVLKALEAKSVGMIDRVATLEKVVVSLLPKGISKSKAKAILSLAKI